MHVGNGPRTGQRWKKKLNIWPKANKDWEELLYVSGLAHIFTTLLLTGEDAHTLSLQVCVSALFCLKQFLCVLSHSCYVSNNKLCTCFYLLEKCIFFSGVKSRRNLVSSLYTWLTRGQES